MQEVMVNLEKAQMTFDDLSGRFKLKFWANGALLSRVAAVQR
jgi:hypothetical protein